ALEKSIRNEYDIVTWTSAKIDGSKLIIQIKENDLIQNTTEDESLDDEMEGYDIIADIDGTVVSIITRSGVPKVTPGDEVKVGDLLVEGCIPIYNEDTTIKRYEYCKADADIILQHSFSVTEEIEEIYKSRTYTGNEIKRNYLMIFEKKIALPIIGNNYELFDSIENQKQLILFGGFKLPVFFGKTKIREYTEEEMTYTKDEIKTKFEEKILKFIQTLEEKGVQIIEKNVTIKKYKGTWTMKVDFEVNESAGKAQKTEIRPLENEQGE
ncbi:MAG: sporulation protein YqfD, partial [Roseburia sp.]